MSAASGTARSASRITQAILAGWAVASETAAAIALVEGSWIVALLGSMGWAALSNVRAYRGEASRERPGPLLHTTFAFVLAGALAVRSRHSAAVLALGYIPIVGSSAIWGGYASVRRVALETAARLESAVFLRRQASLEREAGAKASVERDLRDRLRRALAIARASGEAPRALEAFAALREELRHVRDVDREDAVPVAGAPAREPPARVTSTFRRWFESVRTHQGNLNRNARNDKLTGAVAWLVMLGVGAWLPGVRTTVDLVPWLTLVVGVAGTPLMAVLEGRALRARSDAGYLVQLGASITMMQTACAALVACAGPLGTTAYVAQYAAALSGHAFHFRFNVRTPWALVPFLASLAVALVVARGDVQRVTLVATFALSMPVALAAGRIARQLDDIAETTRDARSRWETELEAEGQARIARLSDGIRDLFGGAHDAASPFFAAQLVASQLATAKPEAAADLERRLRDRVRDVETRLEKTLASASPWSASCAPVDLTRIEAPARIARSGVRIDVELRAATATVYDGRDGLDRVVTNLLGNAVDAACGRVRITCTASEDVVDLVVEDDGPGFGEAFRIRPFGSDKRDGIGIGLFVVERIASLSGGQLLLDRSPDLGGARVIVRLPRVQPQTLARTG
jgi:signal transduction histidine kinase